MFTVSSEWSNCPTTQFPDMNIVVVVTVTYSYRTFGGVLRLTFRFLLESFLRYKLAIPFWDAGSSFEEVWKRSFHHVRSEAIPACFPALKNPLEWYISGCLCFGIIIDTSEWSEDSVKLRLELQRSIFRVARQDVKQICPRSVASRTQVCQSQATEKSRKYTLVQIN